MFFANYYSLRMIDSRLLRKDTLSSVVIGVVPRRSDKEVCSVVLDLFFCSDHDLVLIRDAA